MAKKLAETQNLSGQAQRVVHLIEVLASGSRRKFATLANCSHSAIAKIANGQQVPGAKLLKRIGDIDGVSHEWLMNGKGEPFLPGAKSAGDCRVPIAESLLPGLPVEDTGLLTNMFVELPHSVYRDSVYAIDASKCQPAYGDPAEKLHNHDLLIIDADQSCWKENVRSLDGMLCVTKYGNPRQGVIAMRRLWVVQSPGSSSKFLIKAVSDSSHSEWQEMAQKYRLDKEQFGKEHRDIQFDLAGANKPSDTYRDEIPVASVVGKVILLLRSPKPVEFLGN